MHVQKLLLTEPDDGQYAELLKEAFAAVRPRRMNVAVAYATQSGVAELCDALEDVVEWRSVQKKWLVGIDHCRSDPWALAHLQALPRSDVRIHDGAFVVGRARCEPRISFHPKLYIFSRGDDAALLIGSGNLSQTGLRLGVEGAAFLRTSDINDMSSLTRRFRRIWRDGTPFREIETAYAERYAAQANRRRPAPVEEDAAPADDGARGHLKPAQLRQLRVCQHLWIEAGKLGLNRGVDRPGNQLMLKRNSRVFFGFPARELQKDTAVGSVTICHGDRERPDCSLRFGNNSMDVLTLPIPGREGPPEYDGKVLLFRQIGVRSFELRIGTRADHAKWRRKSEAIDSVFRMTSGRKWGVY